MVVEMHKQLTKVQLSKNHADLLEKNDTVILLLMD